MQNERHTHTAEKENHGHHAKTAVEHGEDKIKDAGREAKKHLKEGQEQIEHTLGVVDKQVRENPWPIIAGVAVGAFLLGSYTSKK